MGSGHGAVGVVPPGPNANGTGSGGGGGGGGGGGHESGFGMPQRTNEPVSIYVLARLLLIRWDCVCLGLTEKPEKRRDGRVVERSPRRYSP